MKQTSDSPSPPGCEAGSADASSIEALNRSCYCLTLDEPALRRALESDVGKRGLSSAMAESHPNLFASVPMFVSREHLERMEAVARAIEAVVATPHFIGAALEWAPAIAQHTPGPRGGLLGLDFHLTSISPKLIEINTNPGGSMLNAILGRVHRACCPSAVELALAPMEGDAIEEALFEVFLEEWRSQRGDARLSSVAIVDFAPEQQYLYPEFLLFKQLFNRHGIETVICDPRELVRKDARLWSGSIPVDFVYNRLTDFALEQPSQAALRLAYLAGEIVLSPHPRAHALYADKRNLTLLCNPSFLRDTGTSEDAATTLLEAIPQTQILTDANRDALWSRRRELFFKPAAGYGSKATYRGEKLTKRVWEEMAQGTYVAQALVPPSERNVREDQTQASLKADVRCYTYAGETKLVAARLYQGQTTNFRTPGGGFAPVFTSSFPAVAPNER